MTDDGEQDQDPTATDTDRELAAALDEATAECNATTARAAEHRTRIRKLRAYLDSQAVDNPDEFGPTGEPKKGSNAGKLAAEIARLSEADNFARATRGHEQRAEQADIARRLDAFDADRSRVEDERSEGV